MADSGIRISVICRYSEERDCYYFQFSQFDFIFVFNFYLDLIRGKSMWAVVRVSLDIQAETCLSLSMMCLVFGADLFHKD